MTIIELFEQLFAGKQLTLQFTNTSAYNSFYSQIRTAKSRYESKFKLLFDESLTGNKVVRVSRVESHTSQIEATFYLGDPIRQSNQQFTIVSINEHNEVSEVENAKEQV